MVPVVSPRAATASALCGLRMAVKAERIANGKRVNDDMDLRGESVTGLTGERQLS